MNGMLLGLMVGFVFGAALYLSDLANPDKIVGTLRLKDFHAMRVIAVFVITGMVGTWLLDLAGLAHFDVKGTLMASLVVGGLLLGIGFGLTGYCPGTGLACAAAGRVDALVTVLGMLAGTAFYIATFSSIAKPLAGVMDMGKVTIPEVTNVPYGLWVIAIAAGGSALLYLTREGRGSKAQFSKTRPEDGSAHPVAR